VDSLIDVLYDRIEADRTLRPLFGQDLANEREAQKRFFTEWLGGEALYSERAYLPVKHRHDLLPISRELAGRWLGHFRCALETSVSDVAARTMIFEKATVLAMALVNENGKPSALRANPHGTCLRYKPAIESLTLARKGDAAGLRKLLRHAPDTLSSMPHAASLLQLAVLAGREQVVELLLGAGVDPDKPAAIEALIFLTPLCAARSKRRKAIEKVLLDRGAKEDLFTHAFLGNLDGVAKELARDRSVAQILDPATDATQITPIHHAIVGAGAETLRRLLAHVTPTKEPIVNGARALRQAAARESVEMVGMLLELGVKADSIGAGRWVLHSELAAMLSRAGAMVDRSGAWIGLSCTGNQGRKDDPEFVAALLRHGARAEDRRLVGQGADGGRATALHYASKAGFLKTIAVLLEHGADPMARDDNGVTPLDWLERSAKSVDREAVRRLLKTRAHGRPC
jgi:hemoglobin